MHEPLAPGSVIGILGGGQLGRMLSIAAARLGLRTHIYEPGSRPPASDVAAACTTAPYDDFAALDTFARAVDVVTLEFENVPVATVEHLAQQVPVRPGTAALRVAQDRLDEKSFIAGLGIATAPYHAINGAADLDSALGALGGAGILKTRRLGYDGKGQARLSDGKITNLAREMADNTPCILEGLVAFDAEISVIGARGIGGDVACFDPSQNEHRDGVLYQSVAPAGVSAAIRTDAVLMAGRIMNALGYTGVMGLELFHTAEGLVANEIAPRVHNSGHWTTEACLIDQFAQHVRAICGWPLGNGSRHANATMTNLLGDEAEDWLRLAQDPSNAVHLYGKDAVKPGRKMGHVTRISPR